MNNRSSGFTLIEIMISVGILSMIAALGLFLSMDFYRGYAFRYEQNLAVSLLQKARSRAMANINQSPHGVHFASASYTLFEGSDWTTATNKQGIPTNSGISTSGLTDVVFEQLRGNSATTGVIVISGQGRTASISINNEGAILY